MPPIPPETTGAEGEAPSNPTQPQLGGQLEEIRDLFGPLYEPYVTTTEYDVLDYLKRFSREDTPPPGVNVWECRIGLSKFVVPPLNINVSKVFRAGAIGNALRQQSSPKFNSGHSETMISMTIYFPTHETIWGFEGDKLEVDFDKAPDHVIDSLASSLRGLVAQFKYAPFLPIKNDYINGTYGITGVTMHSMTVNTVPGFPFCLAVQLNMLSFNHKVYLPMIDNFDTAIHWGRFRQYLGRAYLKLSETASKGFLEAMKQDDYEALINQQNEDSLLARFRELLPEYYKKHRTSVFNKLDEWRQGKNIEIWYPDHTPVGIVYPDLTNFRDPYASANDRKRLNWWQGIMDFLGFPYAADSESSYENAARYHDPNYGEYYLRDENRLLRKWLDANSYTADKMDEALLQTWISKRRDELTTGRENTSINTIQEFETKLRQSWFAVVYESYITDPYLANVFESQQKQTLIKEWEVPMRALEIDPKKAIVNGISVSMGNNFARIQLQLQDEPVHQHLGGLDTRCDISMTVFGESELRKLENLWKHVNGLARLEHGHGVLGFLGMKNIVSALCGMKYVMPENMEVQMTEGFPHVYQVTLSFIDFDVFQQKREILSSDQQAEFIEAFTKRNPFLRIKQRWSAFNAYPDFPLTIRNDKGEIIGNLDPDWYFKAYKTIDDDVADMDGGFQNDVQQTLMAMPGGGTANEAVVDAIESSGIVVGTNGIWVGGEEKARDWYEANADLVRFSAQIPGLTPLGNYQNPYKDKGGNPTTAFKHMMQDAKFRDKDGRMIGAFPTYMLWLIDEGGLFSGIKLYDNFYGLQSVIDIGVGLSEDCMADTMIIQLSNLYSRLSTPYRNIVDESVYKGANIINTQINRARNLASGLTDYLVTLDTVELKPGVRVHLRMGYSANPNAMETVFNGVITNVEQGEIVTITAQSDAIELSAVVNNSNNEGHTGKADGSLWGMWVSEPRDLMIRLLTMGASKSKEATAHATGGRIFSESRWGIRHFGNIMFPTMTPNETALHDYKGTAIDGAIKGVMGGGMQAILGGPAGLFNFGVFDVFSSLSSNLFRKRDYELFKRNIYPGNGTGISQYQGGDLGDAGMALGLAGSTGVGMDGTIIDPATGQPSYPKSAAEIIGVPPTATGTPGNINGNPAVAFANASGAFAEISGAHSQAHPFLTSLGLSQQDGDDDIRGADEVSFRASTYMKSVWDLFQLCAALLPNYIVAIRPFEERSTIFYGKPHWLYTSGVIPLTSGVRPDQLGFEDPDEEILSLLDEARKALDLEKQSDREFYDRLSQNTSADPTASTAGMVWDGRDITSLPLTSPGISGGTATLPHRKGKVVMEMHLPTSGDLQQDIQRHRQIALPGELQHPFYMDRTSSSGDRGGVGGIHGNNPYSEGGTIKKGDDPSWPGATGWGGYLDPNIEQWYMNQLWPSGSSQKAYLDGSKSKKVLMYNTRSKKGVIAAPAEKGPASGTGFVAGFSPDCALSVDHQNGDEYYFGFVEDSAPLGPVIFNEQTSSGSTSSTTGNPTGSNSGTTSSTGVVPEGAPPATQGDLPEPLRKVEIIAAMKEHKITDVRQFAYLYGWSMDHFPVDYTDMDRGIIDELGMKASEVYAGFASDDKAQEVWNEFRMDFRGEAETKPIFKRLFPGQPDRVYDKVVDEFIKFMWQNAYHRGWLVKCVDAQFTLGSALTGDAQQVANFLARVPGIGVAANTISDGLGIVGDAIDGAMGIGQSIVGLDNPFNNSGNHHDFHNARKVFELWLMDPEQAKDFMIENNAPGKQQSGLFGRAVEEFYTKVWDNIADVLGSIASAVGSAVTSLVSVLRFSMLSLGQGISQATFNQQIANMMNRAFNDSIYFQAGPPGSLTYLADNPFTREYGEPVVEIRQPFQRVHPVNSWRHIISNNIQENTEGVANVISATSGGEHTVTVHLDKGIPAEKQVERQVETGLIWDQGGPSGGIPLVRNVLHPVETIRGWQDHFNNGKEETSAKRVALWHLKEGIKDIYGGEITILGDPSIRPFDLIYIGDVYSRMYGICEVEQVVHHFNAEMGFVTSVTPNALVSVNDPARWSMMSYIRARLNTWNLRNDMRHVYGAGRATAPIAINDNLPTYISYNQLARTFEGQLLGAIEFTGGNTALVKDISAMGFTGQLGAGDIGPASGSRRGAVLGGIADWSSWNYVKAKLLDQQSCYIQYLTKDGRPMDAGLFDNRGIGVGQQRVGTLFKNSLRLEVPFNRDGHNRIATNDLLAQLGWNEMQIADLVQDLDLETNLIKAEILDMAGRTDDGQLGNFETHYVTVTKVIDADTIEISPPINGAFNTVRFAGVDAPEVAHKSVGEGSNDEANLLFAETLSPNDPGVRAWRFTFDRIHDQKVAIRFSKKEPTDLYDRILGYVFYYDPEELENNVSHEDVVMSAAGGDAFVSWDAYRDSGKPYTLNWELVVNGHANVYLYQHEQLLPDQGADGSIIMGGEV
jgi:endonuclease YncB( thermonuclease family)